METGSILFLHVIFLCWFRVNFAPFLIRRCQLWTLGHFKLRVNPFQTKCDRKVTYTCSPEMLSDPAELLQQLETGICNTLFLWTCLEWGRAGDRRCWKHSQTSQNDWKNIKQWYSARNPINARAQGDVQAHLERRHANEYLILISKRYCKLFNELIVLTIYSVTNSGYDFPLCRFVFDRANWITCWMTEITWCLYQHCTVVKEHLK